MSLRIFACVLMLFCVYCLLKVHISTAKYVAISSIWCICPDADLRKENVVYHRIYQDIVYPYAKVMSSSSPLFAYVLMHFR